MSKKKYKINLKRFIPFVIVALLLIFALIKGIVSISGNAKNKAPNPKRCNHEFENGICIKCGETEETAIGKKGKNKAPNPKRCSHEFEGGVCIKCGGTAEEWCKHEYDDGVCKSCEKKCDHDFEDAVCKICGKKQPEEALWPNTTTEKSQYPLSSADSDMLVLVNKTYHLSKQYVPDDMVAVSRTVAGVGTEETKKMRKDAADALEKMLSDALAAGYDVAMRTGYRSYDYQENLFSSYVKNHGEQQANTYSAKAGQSEHQTGLACDLGAKSQDFALSDDFGKSEEGIWITQHCAEYGFILRYSDGTLNQVGPHTAYTYEPWHFRYVGTDAAKIITENKITFEEYLEKIEAALE